MPNADAHQLIKTDETSSTISWYICFYFLTEKNTSNCCVLSRENLAPRPTTGFCRLENLTVWSQIHC